MANYFNYYLRFMFTVREAKTEELKSIGSLMVRVYEALEGFPDQKEQPSYYELLRNVGKLTDNHDIRLFVAVDNTEQISGAVVYVTDMRSYGSGGSAPQEKNACGFRLLAVAPEMRGKGVGKLLTQHCIDTGRTSKAQIMVIHTTASMKLAWGMYERMGFVRAEDLDFDQGGLPVYGFRLKLK